MRQSYFILPVLACMLVASETRASEELSVEKLVVQARVHSLVHGMEFGFGSLWSITKCGPWCAVFTLSKRT
jgi:hypothetical protein